MSLEVFEGIIRTIATLAICFMLGRLIVSVSDACDAIAKFFSKPTINFIDKRSYTVVRDE